MGGRCAPRGGRWSRAGAWSPTVTGSGSRSPPIPPSTRWSRTASPFRRIGCIRSASWRWRGRAWRSCRWCDASRGPRSVSWWRRSSRSTRAASISSSTPRSRRSPIAGARGSRCRSSSDPTAPPPHPSWCTAIRLSSGSRTSARSTSEARSPCATWRKSAIRSRTSGASSTWRWADAWRFAAPRCPRSSRSCARISGARARSTRR